MKRRYKKLKRFLISYLTVVLSYILLFFPKKLYKGLSLFFYFSLSRFRKIGERNLKICGFKKKILWENFKFMTENLLDFIRLKRSFYNKNVIVKGEEILKRAFDKKKGVLVLTLHMGFWEIIPVYFSLKGYPVCVLAARVYTDIVDNIVNSIRRSFNIEVVNIKFPLQLIRKLKNNYIVGILMDQRYHRNAIEVKFFNKKVLAPKGPFEIICKFKPEVVTMRIFKNENKNIIEITSFIPTFNIERDVQRVYNLFEGWIKEKPEQWIWIHKRF